MKPNPVSNVLFVESLSNPPTLNMQAAQDSEFSIRVLFRNGRRSKFQTVEFTLKYDPEVVRPDGIDDTALAPLLGEPSESGIDARRGLVTYRAQLDQPSGEDMTEICRIRWKAVGVSSNSAFAFATGADTPTRILTPDGQNVLQLRDDEAELEPSERAGLLDASVAVSPGARTAAVMKERSGSLAGLTLANDISQGTAEGGVTLSLRPRAASAAVGEEFLVDVAYDNPARAELDTVKFVVKFDPRVLEVVDDDRGNWIRRGVNIGDGEYHGELPFDFHLENSAFNATGEIRYAMGFATRAKVPGSGVIATIRFRAVAAAAGAGTTIAFDMAEQESNQRTALSFLGFNLIGSAGRRAEALQAAVVAVN